MASPKVEQVKQIPTLVNKIELVKIYQLSEKEFAKLIKEVEEDVLFKKLAFPQDKSLKVIFREKFPKTDISEKFYELKEEFIVDKDLFNIDVLLERYKECLPIIKSIGVEKFKKYFLYDNSLMSSEEIATECGLNIDEVRKIFDLIDEISIHSEFCYSSTIEIQNSVRYVKVAEVKRHTSYGFIIYFFSPYFVRGKYRIDYNKLEQLKHKGYFSSEELKQLDKLLHKLKFINTRKSILYRILNEIIEVQRNYLLSGKDEDLVPFTQKDLANKINIDPSLVCRAINHRSIITPQGEEKPIKYFLPNEKEIAEYIVKDLILNETKPLTDKEIKNILKDKYGITKSRRSITYIRKELKFPPSFKRRYAC